MALAITIVVIIILATITIGGVFGSDGLINNSKYAAFATQIRAYEEAANRYVLAQQLASGLEDNNINVMDEEGMKEAITGINDEDAKKYVIQDNDFRYNPDNVTDQEEEWLIQLGILAMSAVTIFSITFMANGNIYQTIQSDTIIFPEIDPTSSSGNFAGWYYDTNYTNQAVEGTTLTQDITLYAKWSSYITNKLEGKYIHMIDYSGSVGSSSSGWYYVENEEEFANVPLYGDIVSPYNGTRILNYPSWVNLR